MTSITPKQLGERIKSLRAHAGLSQEEFGAKIGLARQAIGQIVLDPFCQTLILD